MNLKQDVLAAELGFTHQKMSVLGKKQVLKDEEIESIAKAIQLPAQAIKYCDDRTLRDILVGLSLKSNQRQPISNCIIQPLFHLLESILRPLKKKKNCMKAFCLLNRKSSRS